MSHWKNWKIGRTSYQGGHHLPLLAGDKGAVSNRIGITIRQYMIIVKYNFIKTIYNSCFVKSIFLDIGRESEFPWTEKVCIVGSTCSYAARPKTQKSVQSASSVIIRDSEKRMTKTLREVSSPSIA